MATPPKKKGLALLGNPGSGKSTILNGLAGKPVFKSGVTLDAGITTVLKKHETAEFILYDTPGLEDLERKKSAGAELDAMLRENIDLKICFVVTLENGRPRPVDAATIEAVLSAIHIDDLDNSFGVIINQMSEKVYSKLKSNTDSFAEVQKGLCSVHNTTLWHFLMRDPALRDCDDGLLLNGDLTSFFLNLPTTKPCGAPVGKIDVDTLQEKQQQLEGDIKQLQEGQHQIMQGVEQEIVREVEQTEKRTRKTHEEVMEIQRRAEEMNKMAQQAEESKRVLAEAVESRKQEVEAAEREREEMERRERESQIAGTSLAYDDLYSQRQYLNLQVGVPFHGPKSPQPPVNTEPVVHPHRRQQGASSKQEPSENSRWPFYRAFFKPASQPTQSKQGPNLLTITNNTREAMKLSGIDGYGHERYCCELRHGEPITLNTSGTNTWMASSRTTRSEICTIIAKQKHVNITFNS